jgi:hypothetical protein
MNHEAAPAPPSTPSANTAIAMTALAGPRNARPPWQMALDMVSSLGCSNAPSTDGYVHSATIVAQSVMRVTNTIFLRGHLRLPIPPYRRALWKYWDERICAENITQYEGHNYHSDKDEF